MVQEGAPACRCWGNRVGAVIVGWRIEKYIETLTFEECGRGEKSMNTGQSLGNTYP